MEKRIIKPGKLVKYQTTYPKGYKTFKKWLYGYWDGKKVICTDKEFTTVRNPDWLQVVSDGNFIFYLYILLCYVPLSLAYRKIRRYIRIKTGRLLPIS